MKTAFIFILASPWSTCAKTIGLLVLLTLIPPASLLAQNPARGIKFEHLGVEQGLFQSTVFCILQDYQGFMWFGTQEGLIKYDGYNFTVYQHDVLDSTSLPVNHVQSIYEDRTKTLWIVTQGGLSRFDRENEQFINFVHDPKNSYSLGSNTVFTIREDHSGTIWVGTEGGLNKFDREKDRFIRFVHDPNNPHSLSNNAVGVIYEDRNGTLWLGTGSGGLNKFDPQKEQFTRFLHDPKNPHSLSNNTVYAIHDDFTARNTLWIGTNGGLNRFDRDTNQFTRFIHDPENSHSISSDLVRGIYQDHSGTLWIGTPNGLNVFDRDTEQFSRFFHDPQNPHSLSNNEVCSIYEDRSGIIWIGTLLGELNKFDREKEKFIRFSKDPNNLQSLSHNAVNAIYKDRAGTLWVGTHEGLNKFDSATKQFKHFFHDPKDPHSLGHSNIAAIYEDRHKTLWIGTWGGGLNRFDSEKEKFYRFINESNNPHSISSNYINVIYEDSAFRNILWIGNWDGGLNRFNRDTGQFTRFVHDPKSPHSISHYSVWAIDKDHDGALWIATAGGLNRFDYDTEQFTHFFHDPNNPNSLSHNWIWSMCQDHTGTFWLGTAGGGLNKLVLLSPYLPGHKGKRPKRSDSLLTEESSEPVEFTHYMIKDGLPDNTIISIVEDDHGRIWTSTGKGISCFDPRTQDFRNYDVADGLASNKHMVGAYHKSANGEIFFGSFDNGFTAFHPDSIKDNPYIPPVVITAFKRYNTDDAEGVAITQKGISAKKEIQVSYKDNILNFEFAALSYRNTSKNQYAYKLEGFNDTWIQLGAKRDVTFTNLDPGEYTLRMKGSNNDGVWNEEGASLKITVTPPWWKTQWAYGSYVLLFTFLLYGWRRYDLYRVKLQNELRMKNFEAQKLQEVDHMKSRFFANISHEFRTPLTLILGQIDSAIPTIVQEKTKSKMQMAFRNARQLLRLINQLLDLSKIEAGSMALKARRANLIPFLKNLVFSFESLAEQKGITLEFHTTSEDIEIYFEPEKLEKVFYNLLANAFKFIAEGGRVIVDCGLEIADFATKQKKSSAIRIPHSEIQTASAIRNPQSAIITINDTGIGIPANELSRIFDRFYQVDGTHTREHEGTGIGLALAKELVELHHGEITVTSAVGVGTEFVVKLPLGMQHLKASEMIEEVMPLVAESDYLTRPSEDIFIPATATPLSPFAPVEIKPATALVLVVEDNADVRSYIREHLEEHYKIIEATNGEEGMSKAQESIPDLIITDVMMPKMDGFEFSRLLRNDEKTSHIPIIMLTAKASLESKIEGLETGVDDYLTKPFSPKELLARVRNLITLRRQLRERFSTATIIKPSEVSAVSVDQVFLQRVLSAIEANMGEEEFGVENLAAEVHMSVSQLNRKLNGLIDQPVGQLLRSMRLQRAADLLQQNAGTVAEIAYQVGFGSQAHFTTMFQKQFGCTPGEYRKGQRA